MAHRGFSLDHSTLARWVLRFAPILSQRIRCEIRRANHSWRALPKEWRHPPGTIQASLKHIRGFLLILTEVRCNTEAVLVFDY